MIRFEHYQYNSHKNKIQSIYERSFPQSERFDAQPPHARDFSRELGG